MGDGRGTASNSGSGAADSDVTEHDEGDSDGTRRDKVDSAAAARAVAEAVEQVLVDGAAEPAWATAASPDAAARAVDPESVAARLVARTLRRVLGDADGREPESTASDFALGSASTSDLPDAVATALADLATAVESAAVEGETTTEGKVAEGEAAAESEAIARSEAVARAYGAVVPADRRRTRGEYYTPRPVRDLLARLTVTAADDRVLDPACGTGGFLASAVRRKRAVTADGDDDGSAHSHDGALVGVEVAPDPARLAAASLPADVHVADFFDVTPAELGGPFDAVVGNPPYVRHEDISDDAAVRAHLKRVGAGDLSRRADLYAYFLTRATEFLAPGGDLGLVVSDRWLDTRYGEDVQRFLLDNYAVRAVVTFDRGVFDDALVDASLLVVRRREERAARDRTVTRFVRVREATDVGAETDAGTGLRGVAGGATDSDGDAPTVGDLDDADSADRTTNAPTDGAHDDTDTADGTANSTTTAPHSADDIVAAVTRDRPPDRLADGPGLRVATRRQADLRAEAKWNAYHLAPPVYFDLRRDSGTVPLSALADVRYGVKTGANDFFVAPPDEWAERGLDAYATPFLKATGQVETIAVSPADADGWRVLDAHDAATGAGVSSRDAGASSEVAGLAAETAAEEALSEADHSALARYVARGERAGYHERPSLAAREPWFDLGPLPRPRLLATTFTWRVHRVHWNAAGAVPSDQFYAIRPDGVDSEVLGGVLNSRPVWLASEVLGRRAGGEGMTRLQTKVYEAERWPVPDPRAMTDDRRERVRRAFRALRERESAVQNPTADATAAERDALDRAVLGALEVERDVDELLADVRRGVRTLVARRAGEGESPDEWSVTELPPVDGG